MKTHCIFILVNQLEEINSDTLPKLKHPCISITDLISIRKKNSLRLSMEDIFIGTKATWKNIANRIEEYQELSFLRDGKLDIIYYSIYDSLTRTYTDAADQYFHFYDHCIHRNEIEQLIEGFPPSFSCEFKNKSGETSKSKILDIKSEPKDTPNYFQFDFGFLSNKNHSRFSPI